MKKILKPVRMRSNINLEIFHNSKNICRDWYFGGNYAYHGKGSVNEHFQIKFNNVFIKNSHKVLSLASSWINSNPTIQ